MNHPALKWLAKFSWAVTVLITVNFGLSALWGYDFFASNFFMMNLLGLATPLFWLVLLSGLYSGVLFVMMCAGLCGCGSKGKCKC